MKHTIPQGPSGMPEWAEHFAEYANLTDSDTSHLEARVVMLEQALTDRHARRRLRRVIRRSVRSYEWAGPSFFWRRSEATMADWITHGAQGGPAVRPDATEPMVADR